MCQKPQKMSAFILYGIWGLIYNDRFTQRAVGTGLAEKAEREGRTEAQVGYLRMSEFFMYDLDPEKLRCRTGDFMYTCLKDPAREDACGKRT